MDRSINKVILFRTYEFFETDPHFKGVDPALALLLLTDVECNEIGRLFIESGRCTVEDMKKFSVFDYLPQFAGRNINLTNPDLEWGNNKEKVWVGT